MSNIITRNPRTDELAKLHSIWYSSFHSRDGDEFFSFYHNPDLCIVAERDGEPVSMGYLLPVGNLHIDNTNPPIPCAMIYAVASLPEFRNLGFGTAVTEGLINTARAKGYPAVVLCPADENLFSFYTMRTEMREWFYITEHTYPAPGEIHRTAPDKICPDVYTMPGNKGFDDYAAPLNIDPAEYAVLESIDPISYTALREHLLKKIPHINLNTQALEYQNRLCGLFGGGLYMIKSSSGTGCAIIERQSGDTVWIKELLMPQHSANPAMPANKRVNEAGRRLHEIVSKVSSLYPAKEYILRLPALYSDITSNEPCIGKSTRKFAMLALPQNITYAAPSGNTAPWYGLAFD